MQQLTGVSPSWDMIYLYVTKCASTTNKRFMTEKFPDTRLDVPWPVAYNLASANGSTRPVTLTFRRDPLERLVSAVSEVRSRIDPKWIQHRNWTAAASLTPHQRLVLRLATHPMTADGLRAMIDLALTFSEENGGPYWDEHVAPQIAFYAAVTPDGVSGGARTPITQPQPVLSFDLASDPDAVPHGWRSALAWRNGSVAKPHAHAGFMGPDPSSAKGVPTWQPRVNPSDILADASKRLTFLQTVARDSEVMRRICRLYHVDYVCLRLPIPAPCSSSQEPISVQRTSR